MKGSRHHAPDLAGGEFGGDAGFMAWSMGINDGSLINVTRKGALFRAAVPDHMGKKKASGA